MKYKKILAVFLTVLMALAAVSFSAYALTWDGSSAGGSTNAVNGSATGYVIRSTNDSNCVVGYRFSVVNESGAMKVNKVIDVFRKTGNGETARTTSAKFTTKYNKKQLIAHKDSKLVTSQNTTNCYKEADMKFVSDLPNPSGIETWQAYEGNINKVLTKIGVGTTSNMLYGDKVIIEPLFDVCLAGEYQALTVSEIAYCGRSVKGGSSDGGTSTGNSSTWGFIANYTNRIWPNKLFTPDGQGLWDGVSAIASSSKATFNTILTKGYGAGIGYNETNRQKLTIAYDCYGSNVKINTSEGYSLGSYNRLCSTTKTNKTIGGTAHVYYHTLEYNKAIGGSGLHNFSTFGLTAPTGYVFSGWKGPKGVFDETTTTYKPTDFTDDIKSGDATIWLSAQFKPITYTVKYNGNGNTGGSTASSSHTYDVSKALTANGFTKTGHTFAGWNTNTSGTGTNYSNKQSVVNLTATNGATVTLYAKWSPNKYTVTYNANGGTGAPGNQTKTYGVDLTLSSTKPTRSGYTFNGWNTNSGGTGTNYASGGKYTGNANLTLYAKWTPIPVYTIEYNANGGTGTMSSHTTTSSATIKDNAFSKTGYTFDGWVVQRNDSKYYHSDGTGWTTATTGTRKYNSGESHNFSSASWRYASGTSGTLLSGNRTFTFIAQWKPVTYTVSYNANGGTGAPGSQTKTHGVNLTLSSTKPTRTGYTFNGWNTNSSGTGTNYASGGTYSANASVTLYAKWTPNTYTVKYYLDGVEQTGLRQSCTYGTSYNYKPLPSKTGYTVSGWWSSNSSASKGTQYTPGASFSNLTSTNGGTVNRYAYTDAKSYTVKYFLDGTEQTSLRQTCTYGVSYNYKSLPTKTGYTVTGWWAGSSSSNKGMQYTAGSSFSNLTATSGGTVNRYAYSSPITYQVKFNGNGSTSGSMSNQSFTYNVSQNLSANAFKRSFTVTYNYNGNGQSNSTATANATFDGWAKGSTGAKVYSDRQNVINLSSVNGAVVNVYAKWIDASVTLPTPTRTGYIFSGWYTSSSSGTKVGSGGASYTPSANITLYAHWTPITYTVKYNGNGNTGGATASSTHTYDVAKNLTANGFTRTGYKFVNWNTKADGSGTTYTNQQSVKNLTATNGATINLYAQWAPITYTIKFDGNGNTSGSTASMTMTYDEAKALTANGFVRTGYSFTSWRIEKNGQGACYADKQQVKNMTTVNGAVITLYAQWEENRKLSLEAITPNAAYREKTDVITSFNIINEGINDCVPDDNVSVVFKVYKDSTVIKTVTKTKVVVPGNEKNLIYFKWTVPENIGSSTIYISGEIVENGSSYSLIKKSYATCKYNVYTTPDTQYEANAPENFVKPTVPTESKPEMKWSVWEYTDEGFVKKNYGLAFSVSTPVITPAANSNSTRENGFWIMKSGYSFEMSFHNGVRAITGYTIPTADAFTWPQYSVAKFPEFSYLGTNGNCKTLELVGSDWVFRQNADYGRVHFSPLWYPDGEYTVTIQQSDMWTPAGMITQRVNTNQIKIKGSAYDDWYI